MIKLRLALIISLVISVSFSQEYPPQTKHVKIISATVFKKKDTVEHRKSFIYYDRDWNLLTDTNTLSSVLDKGSKTVTLVDNQEEYIQAVITAEGDTLDYIVYLYDDYGNRTNYFQIRKGDTLNDQKRTFDKHGNNLKLFNKKNGDYYLRFEAAYDSDDRVKSRKWYNQYKQLTKIEEYEYAEGGRIVDYYRTYSSPKLVLARKTEHLDSLKQKVTYYKEAQGINYGITITKQKGYYAIEEMDEDKKLKSLEIYDRKGRLTTSVYVTYEHID